MGEVLRRIERLVVLLATLATAITAAGPGELCSEVVASLSTMPSRADWNSTAQRVEIRRCVLFPERGTGRLQLVAWRKGDERPALVFTPELYDGLVQMAMIEGVYAFQFMAGLVQPVVVIVFEGGQPRIALHRGSRGRTKITSDGMRLVVEFDEEPSENRRHEFHRTNSGARRW